MTQACLVVVPPALPGLPSDCWRVSVSGVPVCPGATTAVRVGPVSVILETEIMAPGACLDGRLRFVVHVRRGGVTTVVVKLPWRTGSSWSPDEIATS